MFAIFVVDGNDIIIENNVTRNSRGSGILAWGDTDLTIRGNEVIEAGRGILEDSTAPEPWQECISISRADRFEVADNKVHHGHMEGIDAKADSRNGTIHHNIVHDLDRLGIYIDAWDGENRDIDVFENVVYACPEGIRVNAENGGTAERIRVYGNIVSGCTGNGFWVGVGGVLGESFTIRDIELFGNVSRGNERGFTISVRENSVTERIGVYNNLVYGNGYNGIAVDDYSNKSDVRYITGVLSDIKIVNNTVWGNGFELDPPEPVDWAHGGIFVTASNAEKVLIRNNIVGENRNFAIALHYEVPESEVTIDHNLIRTAAAHPREVLGTEYIEEDPAFVNEKGGDFRLSADSPAIDAGTPDEAPDIDFSGTARPNGNGIDIGAFEYVPEDA